MCELEYVNVLGKVVSAQPLPGACLYGAWVWLKVAVLFGLRKPCVSKVKEVVVLVWRAVRPGIRGVSLGHQRSLSSLLEVSWDQLVKHKGGSHLMTLKTVITAHWSV